MACLITIAILLLVHDGKPVTALTFYLTFSLNTIVALLGSTIMKTALLSAVSAAMGQNKWLWVKKKQSPLALFELVDNASRGPLGSVKLLSRIGAR